MQAIGNAAGEHERSIEECPYRAHEHERVEPAGLAARARGQQNQPVGACRHRPFGVADRGDIGENQRAGIV